MIAFVRACGAKLSVVRRLLGRVIMALLSRNVQLQIESVQIDDDGGGDLSCTTQFNGDTRKATLKNIQRDSTKG